jgi:hypothetical protein
LPIESIPEKTTIGNPEVACFKDVSETSARWEKWWEWTLLDSRERLRVASTQHIPLAKYILIDKANCPKISNVGKSLAVPLRWWTHLYHADSIYRFRQSLVRLVTKKASTVTYPRSIEERQQKPNLTD